MRVLGSGLVQCEWQRRLVCWRWRSAVREPVTRVSEADSKGCRGHCQGDDQGRRGHQRAGCRRWRSAVREPATRVPEADSKVCRGHCQGDDQGRRGHQRAGCRRWRSAVREPATRVPEADSKVCRGQCRSNCRCWRCVAGKPAARRSETSCVRCRGPGAGSDPGSEAQRRSGWRRGRTARLLLPFPANTRAAWHGVWCDGRCCRGAVREPAVRG